MAPSRERSLVNSRNSLAAMVDSKRGSDVVSIPSLTLPPGCSDFNFCMSMFRMHEISDEAKSSPNRFIIVDYKQLMSATSTWYSQCIKCDVKRIPVESMNRTQKEGRVLEVGKTNFESEVLSS